jgi:hypothetical protein
MPSSTSPAENTAPPPAGSTKQQGARATWPSYEELLARQETSRLAFGRMLLNWRRRNGWTQYTVCNWAKAIGEPSSVISYGNLSVIEQGKAGELRQRSFWQLGELNRRIAAREWGRFGDAALRKKLEAAMPLGDSEVPVWGPLEFWACYCGIRPVPDAFRTSPAPAISQRQAAMLSGRWRQRLRSQIAQHALDPAAALEALMELAGEEHGRDFYAVLTGFRSYSPLELSGLWLEGDRYRPEVWLEKWIASSPGA